MSHTVTLLRKYSILIHRWMGVGFCVLFLVWFISGIVMMYWDFPRWTAAKHLARSPLLEASRIQLSPEEAYARLHLAGPPDQVRINMFDGRPVYRFRYGPSESLVYADTGEPITRIAPEQALRVAAGWVAQPASAAEFQGLLEDVDQWTVHPSVRPFGPFLKYAWPNAEEVYVSAATGEVVQHTTRSERFWAWLGAVPHWLYFTPLRKDADLWRIVVTWLSGVGTVMTIFGITVGVWLYSPSKKRYRFPDGRSGIPYAGQKRWHTMLGLIFGLVTCTWALSGMFSMSPVQWLVQKPQTNLTDGIRGTAWRPGAFTAEHPREAIGRNRALLNAKEVELAFVGGQPVYFAAETPERSLMIPLGGTPQPLFDPQRLSDLLSKAARPHRLSEVRVIREYESYYVDRDARHQFPLPVLLVRLNDPEGSMHYVDLRTARVVQSYGAGTRWNRWLYHGLHSLDLPWLYRYRPAWDILVLTLMLGGTALCVTSVVIGWRRLRRKVAMRSARKRLSDSAGTLVSDTLRVSGD